MPNKDFAPKIERRIKDNDSLTLDPSEVVESLLVIRRALDGAPQAEGLTLDTPLGEARFDVNDGAATVRLQERDVAVRVEDVSPGNQ